MVLEKTVNTAFEAISVKGNVRSIAGYDPNTRTAYHTIVGTIYEFRFPAQLILKRKLMSNLRQFNLFIPHFAQKLSDGDYAPVEYAVVKELSALDKKRESVLSIIDKEASVYALLMSDTSVKLVEATGKVPRYVGDVAFGFDGAHMPPGGFEYARFRFSDEAPTKVLSTFKKINA